MAKKKEKNDSKTDHVHDVSPPFQGDTSEDGEASEGDVIKVGDTIVGTFPYVIHAHCTVRTSETVLTRTARVRIVGVQ